MEEGDDRMRGGEVQEVRGEQGGRGRNGERGRTGKIG